MTAWLHEHGFRFELQARTRGEQTFPEQWESISLHATQDSAVRDFEECTATFADRVWRVVAVMRRTEDVVDVVDVEAVWVCASCTRPIDPSSSCECGAPPMRWR